MPASNTATWPLRDFHAPFPGFAIRFGAAHLEQLVQRAAERHERAGSD
ncbi:hypothetical protein RKD23_007729 [Streptomyces sp. SAI-170]